MNIPPITTAPLSDDPVARIVEAATAIRDSWFEDSDCRNYPMVPLYQAVNDYDGGPKRD